MRQILIYERVMNLHKKANLLKIFLKYAIVIFIFLNINFLQVKDICYAKYTNIEKKKVLILHSYDESIKWTEDVSMGIKSVLNNKDIDFYFSYMDMKRDYNKDYLNNLIKFQKEKYKDIKFDVIICSDNNALEYLNTYGKEVFPHVPVIFTGINFPQVSLIDLDRNLFKGVVEEINIKDTIDTMLKLHPKLNNIMVFSSTTLSGKLSSNEVEQIKYLYRDRLNFKFFKDYTTNEFLDKAKEWDEHTAVLFMIDPLRDNSNNATYINKCKEIAKENLKVPIYSFWDFEVGHGVVGGKMISGYDQGKTAAQIALKYLENGRFEDIPFINYCSNKYIFDYNYLRKFNIETRDLPKDSIIVNKPFSFYENYKELVISSIIIFIMLLIIIVILAISIKRKKEDERKLNTSYEELSAVYEELTATEEELRAQYDELQENVDKVKYLAYYDPLTNLPNKINFIDQLDNSIARTIKFNKIGAVYLLDIDDFKIVNDTLGHDEGDELLKIIALKIKTILSNKEELFRFGGDEFLILKDDVFNREEAEKFAKDIIELFNDYFCVNNKPIYVSISMGIIIFPEQGEDCNSILKNVDMAMYKAKEFGKNRYEFYDVKMSHEIVRKTEIEKNLRKALKDDELILYYQPQIDLLSGKITGMEALLRWNSKELGVVSPIEFIKVAEDTGLINAIGEWVIINACKQNKIWKSKGYKYNYIAINISAVQLQHVDFLERVEEILFDSDVRPEYIELEITENVLIKSLENSRDILNKLNKLGIKIALDDFGTGYSSLNYLKILPIDTLKMDKSFIDNICCNDNERSIAESILQLAHKMNMNVVAEGVEKIEQVKILKNMGCNKIQGYYFSKPLPKEEIENLFNNQFNVD